MRRIFEKAVKWLLTASGFVTSIVILLIIGFLFTEGAGLFKEKVIEQCKGADGSPDKGNF